MPPKVATTAPQWPTAASKPSKSLWGPKVAFENGNIGALRRRVPPDQVVTAVVPPRGNLKPPREPKSPRVVELLHKAIEWRDLLDSGKFINQAEIARHALRLGALRLGFPFRTGFNLSETESNMGAKTSYFMNKIR